TDAAISTGANFDDARQNVLAHWLETGQAPLSAAIQAQTDPALSNKLAQGLVSTMMPDQGPDLVSFARGIAEGVLTPSDDLKAALQKSTSPEFFGAILGRYPVGMVLDALRDAGKSLQGMFEGRGVTPSEMLNAALLGMDIKGPIPRVDVLDTARPPSDAVTQAPITAALQPVEPAVREAPVATPRRPVTRQTAREGMPATPPARTGVPETQEPRPFPADAAPAAKLEAILQERGNAAAEGRLSSGARRLAMASTEARESVDEFSNPNFFSNLVKNEDPATQALAKAYDDTASFINWDKSVFGSEAGSGPNPFEMLKWPDTLAPGSRRAIILGKNTAEDLIRRGSNGPLVRDTEATAAALEPFYKEFAPFMPEWRNAQGAAKADTFIGKWLDSVEGRGPVVDQSSPLYPFTRYMQDAYTQSWAETEKRMDAGLIPRIDARENYIAHIVDLSDENAPRFGGGNRTGSLGSLKPREYDSHSDLLRDGYKLKYEHPIDIVMHSLQTRRAALRTLDMIEEAKKTNWVRTVSSNDDKRLAEKDGFKPLLGLGSTKTISTVKDGRPGPVITHQLYGQEGFSNIWNNWTRWEARISNAKAQSIYDALLYAKNTATYAKLINPAFHINTEIKLSMRNGLANAMTEIAGGVRQGKPLEAARGLLDAFISAVPGAKGAQYVARTAIWDRPAYRALKADPALEALVSGGGNISGLARVYATGETPTLTRSLRRGTLGQELSEDFRKAFTFPEIRQGGQPLTDIKNLMMFPFHELSRIASTAVAPVWAQMIPLLKAGAKLERIRTFIRQNPGASDDFMRHSVAQIDRNVEGTMGEMEQRNLFWHPLVKRSANMALLSTAWKYGTIETTLNGLGYRLGRGVNWDPYATTSLMAQIATVAFTNAAWNLLATGQMPQSYLDYLIPFANARGLARVMIPGEEKEYYDWLKIYREAMSAWDKNGPVAGAQQLFASTGKYAENALASIWRAGIDWFNGEYWSQDGHKRQIGVAPSTFADWFTSEFAPIMTTNWSQQAAKGLDAWQNFMGWRAAPKWLSDPAAWQAQQEKQGSLRRYDVYRARSDLPREPRQPSESSMPSLREAPIFRHYNAPRTRSYGPRRYEHRR
ncbi:MAG TPA: hypothetical protein VGR45_05925, partial [Stellaceae bacterium]|nr:hypothetical protein [Stellaceae bacterium]